MEYSTPGECINDLIKLKGSTITGEADALDVSQSTLSDIVNNKRAIRSDTLKKICTHFRVSSDYILGLTVDPSPDSTVQGGCLATGLSGDAVKKLKSATDTDAYKIITRLLESDLFYDAIGEIQKAIECQQSGLVKLSTQLTADILNMFGISSLEQEAEISNHNAHPDKFFDEAISMLAQMAPNITVLSRADTTKFHITEAQNHFRNAVETII